MNIIKALFISIIQGITEFLPVSSSGHILLLKYITYLNIDATFDVVIHMGTLIAVLFFYKKEIYELISGALFKSFKSDIFGNNLKKIDYLKIWGFFIIATIPGGITGLFLEDMLDVEPSNMKSWMFIILALCFIYTAILLFISSRKKINNTEINISQLTFSKAFIIGIFQSLAVLPGVSRSGSTISASLFVGLNKKDAARFSFILSIPLILAAFVLKLVKFIENFSASDINYMIILIVSLITSFIIGYFSLVLLIKLLQKGKFWVFSIYLIIPIIVSLFCAFK